MPSDIEGIKKFIRSREVMEYLDKPNINSVGIGYKVKNGKPTKKIAIQFTVDCKPEPEDAETLESLGTPLIPKSFMVDGKEVLTDVVERTFKPSYEVVAEDLGSLRKTRQDPVMPGISVAHYEETAGTLGGIVYDVADGTPYLLSNWHVLHGPNGMVGDPIVQPGPYDDNTDVSANQIGALVRSHLGLAGDCAVATIVGRDFSPKIYELDIVPRRIARAELDDKVVKSGRTTGVTCGVVRRIEVTTKLNYGGQAGTCLIGGFEIGIDPEQRPPDDEVSKGGDSGSLWLAKDKATGEVTDVVVGLHFAGESETNPDEYALACNIDTVLKKLGVSLNPPGVIERVAGDRARTGYDSKFLGAHAVALPRLTGQASANRLKINGSSVLNYVHFSLTMHKQRRMAIFTAHNVDGLRMKKVPRGGIDWRRDDRLDRDLQVGNEAYENNPWDKGHLVHREATLWGTLREARLANADTFHYTNAAPQHENFNRDEWLCLEDWLLDLASEDNYRLCVFTGPVFSPQDERYRDIQIPAAYWKIVVMRKRPDESLSATAFLMNQYEMLEDNDGRRFLKLRLYQVAIETIESLTGLKFDGLREAQPVVIAEALAVPEGVTPEPWRVVTGPQDIQV